MTAKSWLTMTMLKPYSRCKSASSFRICRCHCTSNALVGSSNTSTEGLTIRARATASRCL